MSETAPLLHRRQLRGLLVTLGMGAGLVTWAHFSFNAFLLIVIPAVSGIVCLLQIVIHGVWFALKQKAHHRQQALAGILAAAI
ncbi:MAG TPA: hypothetical protein VL137_03315, partial [Polyangiaceae bacterium]|nr:hypothetical protein [Polyangiaceae bacterium]